MDTSNYVSTTMMGGIFTYPDVITGNTPVVVQAEQINFGGSPSTVIQIRGSVVGQLTGVYADGVNQTYPGTN